MTFKFTINDRGFVTVGDEIVTSTLQGGSDAENCMVRAARDFRFPRGARRIDDQLSDELRSLIAGGDGATGMI